MADHIQIGDIPPRASHEGDGATATFAFPFPIFTEADIGVYVDAERQTLDVDYAVTGVAESSGGTVVLGVAPDDGADIVLVRELTISRTSDFQASGEFRAKVINDELDFLTAAMQQIEDRLGRTVRLQHTDAQATLELPAASSRAGMLLTFDDDGNVQVTSPGDAGGIAMISAAVPLAATAAGSAGTSAELSAADHSHPLPSAADIGAATQAEAEAGTDNTKVMTPLRTAQAILARFNGTDPIARSMATSALAYAIAVNDATSITGGVGVFWLTDDFATDSLAISTNATYDAEGDYFTNLVYGADLAAAATASASSYYGGGSEPSKSIDGNDATGWVANGASGQWLQLEFSSAREIRRIKVLSGYTGQDATSFDFDVQYYDGGAWTTAANITDTTAAVETLRTYDIPATAADTRWRVIQNDSTSNYWKIQSIEMMEAASPSDMTLSPTAAALDTADPSDVLGYFVLEPVDSVTFGTDVIGKVSIDGGTNKVTGTWIKVGDIGADGEELWRLEADVSAGSGSSLVYEIATTNNKQIRLHDCVGLIASY